MRQLENEEAAGQGYAVTVMGVGNPIMGDDGVGLELLACIQSACTDPRVVFVDGGTGGLELLHIVLDSSRLLLLDAVAGEVPGAIVELTGDQIPRLMSTKLSPHQVGLLDIFSAAHLLGREPQEVVVVGIVPQDVNTRVGLMPVVAQAIPEATHRALTWIERWLSE